MEYNDDWIYNDNVIVFTEDIYDIYDKLDIKKMKIGIINNKCYVEFRNQKLAEKYQQKYCGEWSVRPELIEAQKWLASIGDVYEISDLRKLTTLYLTRRVLDKLPNCIGELKNLQTLYLGYNNLCEIPQCVFKLENLENLILPGNKISNIPDKICEMTNLKRINFEWNPIKEVSEKVYKMVTDNRLYLDSGVKVSREPLTSVKEWLASVRKIYPIDELRNLTILDLTDKELDEIPDCISELKNLKKLYLGYNKFSEIPQCVFKLENLKYLGCSGNKLSQIPLNISKLTKLEYLGLRNNKIKEIPDEICEMSSLKVIQLLLNPIKEVSEKVYKLVVDDRMYLDPTVKIRREPSQQEDDLEIPTAKEAREGTNRTLWNNIGPEIKEKIKTAMEKGESSITVDYPEFSNICYIKLTNLGYTVCGTTVSW